MHMICRLDRHLESLRDKRSPLAYGVIVALEACSIALILVFAFDVLGWRSETGLQVSYERNKVLAIVAAIVIAPLFETILFQLAIQEVLSKAKARSAWIVGASWAAFAISHSGGILKFAIAGMLMGAYLSLTYYLWREKGRFKAFLATWTLHLIYNSAIFLMVIATDVEW